MSYLVFTGLIVVVWAIVFFVIPLMDPKNPSIHEARKTSTIAACSLFVVLTFFSSFYEVDTGKVGVARTFGEVDNSRVYTSGAHFLLPWQTMFRIDNRTSVTSLAAPAESASKDLQVVHTNITLNWHIQQDKIPLVLQTNGLGNDGGSGYLEDKVLVPAILETFKAVISQYTAEELITKRAMVSEGISDTLMKKLANFHIVIEALNITNFQFSDEFNIAIENKVKAAQKALQADADLRRIQTEAKQVIAKANGDAEAIRLQALAIKAQGGEEYVKLKAIEKWNGVLPTMMSNPVPFVAVK